MRMLAAVLAWLMMAGSLAGTARAADKTLSAAASQAYLDANAQK